MESDYISDNYNSYHNNWLADNTISDGVYSKTILNDGSGDVPVLLRNRFQMRGEGLCPF